MTGPAPAVRPILEAFERASDDQVREGLAWYVDAHGAAASLDPAAPWRAAGVIAALSPRLLWAKNLELAARAYAEGRASGTLGRSVRTANRILDGEDPEIALGGPKTLAFYRLIAWPDDPDTVCVDRHAIDVAVGRRLTDAQRSAWYPLDRGGLYEVFADRYRRAAKRLGLLAWQVQAATWEYQRAAFGGSTRQVTVT